ncbi:MAG: serpin family protein [Candidatus Dormibacteraeota bacterium]|uniref:Serpin family protein n=1 Tax=Candidatus Aeolococcus gillhamiae TaxID=3127015 RepID=A0A934JVA2_9BACT|nr:serpin family protein [Candidatus Dormibacteraeota bacterium]
MGRVRLAAVGLVGALSLTLSGSGVTAVLGSGRPSPSPQLVALSRPEQAAAAERSFADDLVAALSRERDGNVVLSPASIFDVLALLAPGAQGSTATQLDRALHATGSPRQFVADLMGLEQHLGTAGGTVTMASAAWLQQGYPLGSAYRQLLTDAGAPPQIQDFRNNPDGARQSINQWVSDQTNRRIDDLFAPGTIRATTRLVLANAVALQATWRTPFPQQSTQSAPFATPTGSQSVSMMRLLAPLDYVQTAQAQAVRLPYSSGGLDALVALPNDPTVNPLTLLPELSATAVPFSSHMVALALPRFQTDTTLDLQPTLGELGLGGLFAHPDLSGIGGLPGDLRVDAAVHKAWISVDETGTQATAASGVSVGTTAAPLRQLVSMTVDRPFLFVVEDSATSVPLFVARINDPVDPASP